METKITVTYKGNTISTQNVNELVFSDDIDINVEMDKIKVENNRKYKNIINLDLKKLNLENVNPADVTVHCEFIDSKITI